MHFSSSTHIIGLLWRLNAAKLSRRHLAECMPSEACYCKTALSKPTDWAPGWHGTRCPDRNGNTSGGLQRTRAEPRECAAPRRLVRSGQRGPAQAGLPDSRSAHQSPHGPRFCRHRRVIWSPSRAGRRSWEGTHGGRARPGPGRPAGGSPAHVRVLPPHRPSGSRAGGPLKGRVRGPGRAH